MAPRHSARGLRWALVACIQLCGLLASGRLLPSSSTRTTAGAGATQVLSAHQEAAGAHARSLLVAGDIVGRYYCGTTPTADPYAAAATWAPITATQLLAGSPGSFTGVPISFADAYQFVYQSACVGPTLRVRLTVPAAGDYLVTAMFAEPYFQTTGARVFDVASEGVLLLDGMDVVREAGAAFRAVNMSFPVKTTDTALTIVFTATSDQAIFSGLVIAEAAPAPPTSTTNNGIGIYCGDLKFTNNGRVWSPAATSPYVVSGLAIGPTYGGTITNAGTLARVYRSECFGNPSIRFPVPQNNAYYAITFYFSENYWTTAGSRIFSILIEGKVVFAKYDIVADVGPKTAVTKTFYVLATDGSILINFVNVADQAHFSGIAIDAYTFPPGTPVPSPPSVPSPTPPSPVAPPPSPTGPPPVLNVTSGTFQMYCGSGAFIDAWGGAWSDNTVTALGPSGFANTAATIEGAPVQLMRVYQAECVAPVLTLTIPVPAASNYDVTILNSENYFSEPNARIFSVAAEGAVVLPSIDLVALAGGKNRAVNTTFRVAVTDGTLNIKITATKDQARFGGIYVIPADGDVPAPPPITAPPSPNAPPPTSPPPLNATSPAVATWCGPTDYVDENGVLWQSHAFFTGAGFTYVYGGGIANTTPSLRQIYGAECVGPDFSATFTGLAAGDYTVSILSAETYFTAANSRLFSVTIQGTKVLNALDMYADFGPLSAVTLKYVVPDVTSSITFRFTASKDQARIGGIMVMPGAQAGVPVITPAPAPPPGPTTPAPGGIIPPITIPSDPNEPALSINYNGAGFKDSLGYTWVPADPFNAPACAPGGTGAPITGAPAALQNMLQTECFGAFKTTIPVQASGTYKLRFWNTEIFFQAPNLRKFDVVINGVKLISEWDVFAESGGQYVATYKEVTVAVTTPTIVIEYRLIPGFDQPSIKGLQLIYVSSSTFTVQPTPPAYSFQLVDPNNPINNKRNVTFQALVDTLITGVRVQKLQPAVFPDQPVFVFQMLNAGDKIVDTADNTRVSYDPPVSLLRGTFLTVEGTFLPRDTGFYACRLEVLAGVTVVGAVNFDGTGDVDANVPHVLHVVADGPRFLVDVDNTGVLPVSFAATSSHTHDPAHRIVAFQWADVTAGANTIISTKINASATLAPGSYAWSLTIFDDAVPPSNKTDTIHFDIYSPDAVPGTFVRFYLGLTGADLGGALPADSLAAAARMPGFKLVAPLPARVSNKPMVAQMKGKHTFPAGGATLSVTAGTTAHAIPFAILIDGEPVALSASGTAAVSAGPHTIELQAFVNGTADLPVSLLADGTLLGQADTVYNELLEGPVVNSVSPLEGIVLGSTRVTIQGFGWKMSDVEVSIGDIVIPNEDIVHYTANSFYFLTPAVAGPSSNSISITSKNKTSNAFTFRYLAADQPVPNFRQTPFQYAGEFNGITCGQWCHGRYFIAGTGGHLYEVEFNEDHTEMTKVTVYDALVKLQIHGKLVLGLACNPLESSESFKIWLTHSDMFDPAQDPTTDIFQGISEYSGRVGYFQWPAMDTYTIVIDNLPCATVFHSVASLTFDNLGLLYIGVGANTNTGAPAPRFGNLAESPWSAGLIRADVMNPNFKGRIKYELRNDPNIPPEILDFSLNDQRAGLWVQTVATSTRGMEMYAYGLRNPLGLTFHTNGKLYTCDNGPNADSGPALLSPFNYSTEYVGTGYDRIDLIERNSYHGIGNENRAMRGDIRQGTYIAREANDIYYKPSFSTVVNGVPVNYTEPIGLVLSSSNGMDEYRANTFLGAMRGWLLISKLATFMYFVKLSPDGESILDIKRDTELNLPQVPSLKTITGPGGVIIGIDYDTGTLRMLTPVDTAATVAGLTYIYDIYPWRAPKNIGANQTFPFVISGANFQNLEAPLTVLFGTQPAGSVTKTNSTITGTVPAFPTAPDALLDITVTTASGSSYKLDKAFRYLDDYTVQLDMGPRW